MINAHVMKLLIDADTKHTYGVKFWREGKIYSVYTTKEVILSAGALNSPQLLMLSGLGPRNHLQSHGIPVIADISGIGRKVDKSRYLYSYIVAIFLQSQKEL